MKETRYRVTLDVDVEMAEISKEWADARLAQSNATRLSNGFLPLETEVDEATIAAAAALQREVLRDQPLLDQLIRRLVLMEIEVITGLHEGHRTGGEESPPVRLEDILHPAIERLPPRERHWWRQMVARDDDEAGDAVDHFYTAFDFQLGPLRVGRCPPGEGEAEPAR